jgi:hypothetical protein
MRSDENALCRAILAHWSTDKLALDSFMQRLGLDAQYILHPASKVSAWRYSKVHARWWETDILLLLDPAPRLALHIEVKLTAGFTDQQIENYALRAAEWASHPTEGYSAWRTILLAPRAYLSRHRDQASAFDHAVALDDLGVFVSGHPALPAVDPTLRVFFPYSRLTPTRLRTLPIGQRDGQRIREFEIARHVITPATIDTCPGHWVHLNESDLKKRGITPDQTGPWEYSLDRPKGTGQ